METTIIIERYQPNAQAWISLKTNDGKCDTPCALASDILKCYQEFINMSTMRTGTKHYVVEPNGHMRITDNTVFK